jgi:O-antigen/teichoic acid export membrane protein
MSTRTTFGPRAPLTPAAKRPEAELRPLSLRSNFAWTLTGNILYNVCQAGWIVVLAKMGNPEMVGRFGMGLAVTAPVVMFTRLQLRSIQATDARDEYRFGDYLSLRLISTAVAMAVIALIASSAVLFADYHRGDVSAWLAIALMRASEGVSDCIYGLLQKWERLDLISRSMMIKGPTSVIALAAMIRVTHNVAWGALGIMAAWTALMFLYDVRNARRIMRARGIVEDLSLRTLWSGRLPVLRRLTWLALPLGFVALLDSLNVNVPRYVIQGHMGLAALGYFTAISSVTVGGNMTVASLATSASPRLSRHYVDDIAGFKRLTWKLVQFGIVLGGGVLLIALLFGRQLLTVLYTAEYAHVDVFAWLMAAAGLGYVARFLVYSMTAARYLRAQTPLYALSLGILGGLSLWLIPSHGLLGAAWAAFGGTLILLVGAIAVNLHAIRTRSAALAAEAVQPSLPSDWT